MTNLIWLLFYLFIGLIIFFIIRIFRIKSSPDKNNNRDYKANQGYQYENRGGRDFLFIRDEVLSEIDVVSSEDFVPLDNRYGSSPVVSEHEFSKTVHNSIQITKTKDFEGCVRLKTWSVIDGEIKGNIASSIGIQIGESITKRTKVTLEVGPGKNIQYKIIWKQRQRKGHAIVMLQNRHINIPYKIQYNLSHSVQSIESNSV